MLPPLYGRGGQEVRQYFLHDSLGEGFATKGDKKNAILNFKKALSLHPAPNVKINSEKFLKDLGAL